MTIELPPEEVQAAGRRVLLVELHAQAVKGVAEAGGSLHNLASMLQKGQPVDWEAQLDIITKSLRLHIYRRDEIAKELRAESVLKRP